MKSEEIKSAKRLALKPNPYLVDPMIPFLYQSRMILMMLVRPRLIVGDDIGLGKTLESILAFTHIKAAYPETKLLVLSEKAAYLQWVDEIAWLAPSLGVTYVEGNVPGTNT